MKLSILTLAGLLFVTSIGAALAAENEPIAGMIISVRGSVYQIQPTFLRGVQRVLIDDDTLIVQNQPIKLENLKAGDFLLTNAIKNDDGSYSVTRLNVGDQKIINANNDIPHGIQPDFYPPNSVKFAGTIKSFDPLIVTVDGVGDITAKTDKIRRITRVVQLPKDQLMIGTNGYFDIDRRAGDIVHANAIFVRLSPGKAGTVFGKILAVKKSNLKLLPRFASESINVTVEKNMILQRQVNLDLNTVNVGDTISVWCGHTSWNGSPKQLTAYAIIQGEGSFPAAGSVSIDDPSGAGRVITGNILQFDPLKLQTKDGAVYEIAVPGQTPYTTYIPSKLSELKPGTNVMLVCDSVTSNRFTTQTVVLDASPIVSMGL